MNIYKKKNKLIKNKKSFKIEFLAYTITIYTII